MSDSLYLKELANGLKISDIKSLSVIMGPEELKTALKGLSMADFDNGVRLITLHNHTTVSDGRVAPEDYLDNALSFKQKYGYRDLIVAVTDHDYIDALPIILKKAQQNPQKYQGIRLVLGCELSVSYYDEKLRRPIDFEVLHYGINPFDRDYVKWLSDLRQSRLKAMPRIFSYFRERYPQISLNLDELLERNICMKRGFGCYAAYVTPRFILEKLNDPGQTDFVWDYFRRLGTPLADEEIPFWHTLDDVINRLKKHRFGFLSVAHPYRIHLDGKVYENGPEFLDRFFTVLKKKGIQGLEIFYMNLNQPLARSLDYMLAGYQPCSETDRWVKTIVDFADENDMIKTGGTDCHTAILGGRKRQLVSELTEILNRYKPLIQEGYHVLDKEVTLGLPAPCMPPESAYHDTGIGSSCGAGARRIYDFFEGVFDKIQLGPMGQTLHETNHSPYVSDMAPNPFFIPLEYLARDGYLSEKTLTAIYDIPKQNGTIDFNLVEKVYDKALHEAYRKAGKKQNYNAFIKTLSGKYHHAFSARYIADLQVRIPSDAEGLHDDLFLPDFSLGSPPDTFSKIPRNWHFRVFNPKYLFDENGDLGPAGRVWYNLIDKAMENASGGLRIDHYIGFINPFVISDKDPNVYGRLYSSPDIPELAPYAKNDFSDITRKIILDCARKHNLTSWDIYAEDIGSRPQQMDEVMRECGLGRLLIAQFLEPDDWNHMYHLANASPLDVAVLDTHDTPSVQAFFRDLPEDKKVRFSWLLATDLRFNYTDDLKRTEQLVRMQWGALLASPAKRVQAFFTSWIGQEGRYNQPGNPIKWKLRCVTDFERLYFENLAKGLAYNPFDAICLAIYARGEDFYRQNEALVMRLREAENELLSLAREL